MKAVLVREFGEYILHKFADAEVVFAMSDHKKADEKELRHLDGRNCDKISRVFNINQLTEDYVKKIKGVTKDEKDLARVSYLDGLIAGIGTDQDKIFTEKEMSDALTWAASFQGANQVLNESTLINYINTLKEKLFQDAILVEIEMQYLPVSTFCFECGKGARALNETTCDKKYACSNWFPKYDDNGCLILKKAHEGSIS
jgi:hypothetical protein